MKVSILLASHRPSMFGKVHSRLRGAMIGSRMLMRLKGRKREKTAVEIFDVHTFKHLGKSQSDVI